MANVHGSGHKYRFLGDVLGVITHTLKPPDNKLKVEVILDAGTVILHAGGQLLGNRFLSLVQFSVLAPDLKRVFEIAFREGPKTFL